MLWIFCVLWLNRSTAPAPVPAVHAAASTNDRAHERSEAVTDISFREMFVTPIGPRGATYTPRLLELAGKRVRLKGYMVRRATYTPGRCVLTQVPMQLNEREMGMADDLPISATWIDMPGGRGGLTHVADQLEVTGRLSLGPRKESDGRVSHVRIIADSMGAGRGEVKPDSRKQ